MKTEPPAEFQKIRHHWLVSERASTPSVAEWLHGAWFCANEIGPVSGEEMARRGWDYGKPCTIEPGPAAVFSPLEAAAVRLYEAEHIEFDRWPDEKVREDYRFRVREVLRAVRNPGFDMKDAGGERLYGHPRAKAIDWAKEDKFECDVDSAEGVWLAMIDKLIGEEK